MEFCWNCDNEAVSFYVNENGDRKFLCATCESAFERGQTIPDAAVMSLDDNDECAWEEMSEQLREIAAEKWCRNNPYCTSLDYAYDVLQGEEYIYNQDGDIVWPESV